MIKTSKECDINNVLLSENPIIIKEEVESYDFFDLKVCICETTVNRNGIKLEYNIYTNKIEENQISSVENGTDLPLEISSTVIEDIVKKEEEVSTAANLNSETDNRQLICSCCLEHYQDYCSKCGMLVHILNGNTPSNPSNKESGGIPKDILEIREVFGRARIFALKVIPKNVKFGPFTGLTSSEYSRRMKRGKFLVNSDNLKLLNWMQYVKPARNNSKGNLLVVKFGDDIYYCSRRVIQEGEELLVYFGEEYEHKLNTDAEVVYIPPIERDVKNIFACTFCCLGFSSKRYLLEHKNVCSNRIDGRFLDEEIIQCSVCKIYLGQEEYLQHHKTYCNEENTRRCVRIPLCDGTADAQKPPGNKSKRPRRRVFKCTHCKYKTTYRGDIKRHAIEHYVVRKSRCGICHRRFNAKDSLKAHVEKEHIVANNSGGAGPEALVQEQSPSDVYETPTLRPQRRPVVVLENNLAPVLKKKSKLKRHGRLRRLAKNKYGCANCEFRTNRKTYLIEHIRRKHLKVTYKCSRCTYKTLYKVYLKQHMKRRHSNETDYRCQACHYRTSYMGNLLAHVKVKHIKGGAAYKCSECEFKTGYESSLTRHVNVRHLKKTNHECQSCSFKTNCRASLDKHTRGKHFKERIYKCEECSFKTCYLSSLERHVNGKHLKETKYECMHCGYVTSYKITLERHMKQQHSRTDNGRKRVKCAKPNPATDYACAECQYKTRNKGNMQQHVKNKHLKKVEFICAVCEYKTNYKQSLKQHIRAKHVKDVNYECAECGYATNYKGNLDNHIKRKHLKEVEFICAKCDYKTSYKDSLVLHVKTKHLKEFSYKCESCEYKTNYKVLFRAHVKRNHS